MAVTGELPPAHLQHLMFNIGGNPWKIVCEAMSASDNHDEDTLLDSVRTVLDKRYARFSEKQKIEYVRRMGIRSIEDFRFVIRAVLVYNALADSDPWFDGPPDELTPDMLPKRFLAAYKKYLDGECSKTDIVYSTMLSIHTVNKYISIMNAATGCSPKPRKTPKSRLVELYPKYMSGEYGTSDLVRITGLSYGTVRQYISIMNKESGYQQKPKFRKKIAINPRNEVPEPIDEAPESRKESPAPRKRRTKATKPRKKAPSQHKAIAPDDLSKEFLDAYQKYVHDECSVSDIVRLTGLSRNTVYKYIDIMNKATGHQPKPKTNKKKTTDDLPREFLDAYKKYADGEYDASDIIRLTGLASSTVYRYIRLMNKSTGFNQRLGKDRLMDLYPGYVSGEYTMDDLSRLTGMSCSYIRHYIADAVETTGYKRKTGRELFMELYPKYVSYELSRSDLSRMTGLSTGHLSKCIADAAETTGLKRKSGKELFLELYPGYVNGEYSVSDLAKLTGLSSTTLAGYISIVGSKCGLRRDPKRCKGGD